MAGFTASWVHGNAVVAEDPIVEDGGMFGFNHFGWGTQIVMRPGFSRWFHIPLPTPVILDGARLKLIRAFIQLHVDRLGSLQRLDLWDGDRKVGSTEPISNFKSSPAAQIPGHQTFELIEPHVVAFGLGLSFRLSATGYANGNFIDNRDAPMFVIGSAGADYEVS
jgi:hypothetical protein